MDEYGGLSSVRGPFSWSIITTGGARSGYVNLTRAVSIETVLSVRGVVVLYPAAGR